MNNKYIKIQGHPDLVKDPSSGAILNVDNKGLELYKRKKLDKFIEEKKINRLENEVQEMKSLLTEILKEIKNK